MKTAVGVDPGDVKYAEGCLAVALVVIEGIAVTSDGDIAKGLFYVVALQDGQGLLGDIDQYPGILGGLGPRQAGGA